MFPSNFPNPNLSQDEIEELFSQIHKKGIDSFLSFEYESILTYNQYSVWFLRRILGISYKEIARQRGVTESTCRDLYMKAQRKIEQIEQFYEFHFPLSKWSHLKHNE